MRMSLQQQCVACMVKRLSKKPHVLRMFLRQHSVDLHKMPQPEGMVLAGKKKNSIHSYAELFQTLGGKL